jgi:hypothetical protein
MNDEAMPVKVILVNGFPFRPPRAFIDKQMNPAVVHNKSYLGAQNEITIPYIKQWNMATQSNLADLIRYIDSTFQSDPPTLSEMELGMRP